MMWPLPALLAWAAAWGVFASLRWANAPLPVAIAAATLLGAGLSFLAAKRWKQMLIGVGFPLSLAATALVSTLPAWLWLLPLVLLVLLYPFSSWRDAPLFPTPTGALSGLQKLAPLRKSARLVDAGCGLGHGLSELHREYPQAQLVGLEWSWLLRWACAWRCRWSGIPAQIRRADIWGADWSGYDMVYLFQRPETMPRAVHKAQRELRPGCWLASLEFEAEGLLAKAVNECPDGRRVWLYQAPFHCR